MIKIIGVGAIKEDSVKKAISLEISKIRQRMGIEIISVDDEKCPENLSEKEKTEVKRKEGEKILRHIKPEDYVVALTLEGKSFTQSMFAKTIRRSNVCFVIGGSLGLGSEVLRRANAELSFGPMTFPHQLMRWILLEQIRLELQNPA